LSSIDYAFYRGRSRSWWESRSWKGYEYRKQIGEGRLLSSLFEKDLSKIGGRYYAYKSFINVRNNLSLNKLKKK
jgi:hypothetical protein